MANQSRAIFITGDNGAVWGYDGVSFIDLTTAAGFATGIAYDYVFCGVLDKNTGETLFVQMRDGAIRRLSGGEFIDESIAPLNANLGFWDVLAFSPNDIFICGQDRTAMPVSTIDVVYHYDGIVWSSMVLPVRGTVANFPVLRGLWGTDPRNVYAVGCENADQYGYLLHYNGDTWHEEIAPAAGSHHCGFWSIAGAHDDNIRIAGLWPQLAPKRRIKLKSGGAWADDVAGSTEVDLGNTCVDYQYDDVIYIDNDVCYVCGGPVPGAVPLDPRIKRLHNGTWTTQTVPATANLKALVGLFAISIDEVYCIGGAYNDPVGVVLCSTDRTTWTKLTLPVGMSGDDLCGITGCVAPANFSFETVGVYSHQAKMWQVQTDVGACEIGRFHGSVVPFETFENAWGTRGSQHALGAFEDEDLVDGPSEDFEWSWQSPNDHGYFDVSDSTGFPAVGELLYDRLNEGSGRIESIAVGGGAGGSDRVSMNTVNWITPGAGLFALVGAILTERTLACAVLSTGAEGGAQSQYEGLLVGLPVHPYSFVLRTKATDGTALEVADDGSGVLIGDVDSTGTNTVDYTYGDVDVTFSKPVAEDAQIYAIWYHGEDLTQIAGGGPLPTVVTTFTIDRYDSWNHQGGLLFYDWMLGSAPFDVTVEYVEDFEEEWDSNETSSSGFPLSTWTGLSRGAFDVSQETVEDFEEEWDSNEDSEAGYQPEVSGGGTSAFCWFNRFTPPALVAYEDFETDWTTVML